MDIDRALRSTLTGMLTGIINRLPDLNTEQLLEVGESLRELSNKILDYKLNKPIKPLIH